MVQKTSAVPVVTVTTPEASTVGCHIKVTGANFDFVEYATVGGVKCKVDKVESTTLTVIVADDAKSGRVVLYNDTGPSVNQPLFTVTVPDKIPPRRNRIGQVIGPNDDIKGPPMSGIPAQPAPQPAPGAPHEPWKHRWQDPNKDKK
jgi:hypothetical protein